MGSQSVEKRRLLIGGVSCDELADRFGTPLYLFDASDAREKIERFVSAADATGEAVSIAFASKANGALSVLKLMLDAGLDVDVASEGELEGAVRAGFPPERIQMHGSNKSDAEIETAVRMGIKTIVLDNVRDIQKTSEVCESLGRSQNVMIRLAPGIHPETHEAISTGQDDTKFGFNISDGAARDAVERISRCGLLHFAGIHMHIGSQLMEGSGIEAGAHRMAQFAIEIRPMVGTLEEINCGGGLGIRYLPSDALEPIQSFVSRIVGACTKPFRDLGMPPPRVGFEMGRYFVGEAGSTLYRIGRIKTVPIGNGKTRTYASVDGGLADNPRPQLYGAVYYALNASRPDEPHDAPFRIAGRHCETDRLIPEVHLPAATREGDLLLVQCTGAYNFSMASNYNRYTRPAMVIVADGEPFLAVERETVADLFSHERIRSTIGTIRQ